MGLLDRAAVLCYDSNDITLLQEIVKAQKFAVLKRGATK